MSCVFHFSELSVHLFCPLSSWGPSYFLNLLHSLSIVAILVFFICQLKLTFKNHICIFHVYFKK